MNKKIIVITFVSILLLTGLSTNSIANNTSKTLEKNNGYLAVVDIYIDDIEEFIYGDPEIVMGGFLDGTYKVDLNVYFDDVYSPYEIKGTWGCFVGLFSQIPGQPSVIFYDDVLGYFDYGMGENPPDDIHETVTKTVPFGLYEIRVNIFITVFLYEDGIRIDTFEFEESWSKSKVKNKPSIVVKDSNPNIDNFNFINKKAVNIPFLNWLQSHPNIFPLLQLLIQRLGLP